MLEVGIMCSDLRSEVSLLCIEALEVEKHTGPIVILPFQYFSLNFNLKIYLAYIIIHISTTRRKEYIQNRH